MNSPERKKSVLFVCTHNSARSQMAEGYLRARYRERFNAFSAGTRATSVHPPAIAVMEERGIDIPGQRSPGSPGVFRQGDGRRGDPCATPHGSPAPSFPGQMRRYMSRSPTPRGAPSKHSGRSGTGFWDELTGTSGGGDTGG